MKNILALLLILFLINGFQLTSAQDNGIDSNSEIFKIFDNRTPDELKIESGLFYDIIKIKQKIDSGLTRQQAIDEFRIKSSLKFDDQNRIMVIVSLKLYPEAYIVEALIEHLGGNVTATTYVSIGNSIIKAWVPILSVPEISRSNSVAFIQRYVKPTFD